MKISVCVGEFARGRIGRSEDRAFSKGDFVRLVPRAVEKLLQFRLGLGIAFLVMTLRPLVTGPGSLNSFPAIDTTEENPRREFLVCQSVEPVAETTTGNDIPDIEISRQIFAEIFFRFARDGEQMYFHSQSHTVCSTP